MTKFERHCEKSVLINAVPEAVFSYADDHKNFSSHMNKSSWMMGGGKMETYADEGDGQKIGSHIKMNGKIFGLNLYLDEIITVYDPPVQKEWKTVGDIYLIIIGRYKLGFKIISKNNNSELKVYIDYDLPTSFPLRILGYILGAWYAKWCVNQMAFGTQKYFEHLGENK